MDCSQGFSYPEDKQQGGRSPQKVVAFLEGYEETEIPEKMVHVFYDTGIEKKGKMVQIG